MVSRLEGRGEESPTGRSAVTVRATRKVPTVVSSRDHDTRILVTPLDYSWHTGRDVKSVSLMLVL